MTTFFEVVGLVYRFETNLTKDQIIYRLNTFGDTGLNQLASSKEILYKVSKNKIRMVKNPKTNYRTFVRAFYGEIEYQDGKTYIHGKFKHSLFVTIFILIWFCGVILIGGSIFIGSILTCFSKTPEIGPIILGVIIPPALLGYGIFFYKYCEKPRRKNRIKRTEDQNRRLTKTSGVREHAW